MVLTVLTLMVTVLLRCVFDLSFFFSEHYIWPIIPLAVMTILTVMLWSPFRSERCAHSRFTTSFATNLPGLSGMRVQTGLRNEKQPSLG